MSRTLASKRVVSSPLEMGTQPLEYLEFPPSLVTDQESMPSLEQHVSQSGRKANVSIGPWRFAGHGLATRKNIFVQPSFSLVQSHTVDMNDAQHENGLFSSSMSEIFNKKLTLSTNNVLSGQSVDASTSHCDEPMDSLEDIQAQTIGSLLPDDDLFSEVFDEVGYISQPTNGDDIEESDFFGSGGGMESIGDDGTTDIFIEVVGGSISSQKSGINGSNASEHPRGEHPSRTPFVRNFNNNVEESELKPLFEQYGNIRILYTACKYVGIVMISYDMRAARNVMRAIQEKPLRRRKLDIQFSFPKLKTKLFVFDRGKQNQNEDKFGIENG